MRRSAKTQYEGADSNRLGSDMGWLRKKLSAPLRKLAARSGLAARVARRQPVYRIIMHHGIGNGDLEAPALERQLVWLARNFRVVALDALIERVASGAPASGEVALTFDDGLACHAEVVAPLLRRLGLPATFFVCPTLIDEQRWLWSHEARERLRLLAPAERSALASELGAPGADIEEIVLWMKGLPWEQRIRADLAIAGATPRFAPDKVQRSLFDPLTWEQFAAFDSPLFTIGSHSSTHPMLPTLDDTRLEAELVGSRATLQRRLGRTVDLFCYPSGRVDSRVRAAVARSYRAAVGTRKGPVRPGSDPHDLARIHIADDVPSMAWRMFRPSA